MGGGTEEHQGKQHRNTKRDRGRGREDTEREHTEKTETGGSNREKKMTPRVTERKEKVHGKRE